MWFFRSFGRESDVDAIAKHAAAVADKRLEPRRRQNSIRALGEMKNREAVEALLQRFTFRIDLGIEDDREKELASAAILRAGKEAVTPVRAFLATSERIAWPVRILRQLVSLEMLVGDLLALLETMHVGYERDPERKLDTIVKLGELDDPRIAPEVVRFLEDANERVRFSAVETIVAQRLDDSNTYRIGSSSRYVKERLLDLAAREESVRVRVLVFKAFDSGGWSLGNEAERFARSLPHGFALSGDKVVELLTE